LISTRSVIPLGAVGGVHDSDEAKLCVLINIVFGTVVVTAFAVCAVPDAVLFPPMTLIGLALMVSTDE
jgi:hypothetical protein